MKRYFDVTVGEATEGHDPVQRRMGCKGGGHRLGLDFDDDDIDVLLVGCGVFQETPNDNNDGETTTKPTPHGRRYR